jgi:iron complex transport system ATP-binding protein
MSGNSNANFDANFNATSDTDSDAGSATFSHPTSRQASGQATSQTSPPSSDRIVNLLSCNRLQLRAGKRILIDALDWQVAPGQLWCVLGPNGVGKSTLLYTVAGLQKPAGGRVLLDGKPFPDWPAGALAHARGLMMQQQVDAFSATALDAVLVGRTPHRVAGRRQLVGPWDSEDDLRAARQALEQVGMTAFESADVMRLSGGERQRVALASLLAQAPRLMLLDEPTSHQDVAHQLSIMRLVRSLAAQHAVVVTTHDINLAARFATHVLLLSPRDAKAGAVEEILTTAHLQDAFGCAFDLVSAGSERLFVARRPA